MNTTQQSLSRDTSQIDSLQARARVQTWRMPNDRGLPAHFTPLPRPQWLPENVWPFETVGLDVDGSMVAVTDVGRGPTLLSCTRVHGPSFGAMS